MNVTTPSTPQPLAFSTLTSPSAPATATDTAASSTRVDTFERVSPAAETNDFASVLREVQAEKAVATNCPVFPSTPTGELGEFGVIASKLEAEATMNLQPGSKSGFLKSQVEPAKGVVLALHGWSAGTWQFEHVAEQLSKRGYHVYAPRLPGHGYQDANGEADQSKFPKNHESQIYRDYADQVYAEAKSVGLPISIVGLSGGGSIGLDIAGRYPDVESATLYDPFLSPAYPGLVMVHLAIVLDTLTFGAFSKLLRKIPIEFTSAKNNSKDWGRDGHVDFNGGMIYGLSKYGRRAARDAKDSKVPMQIVSSEYENNVVSRQLLADVYRADTETRGWHHYTKDSEVTHAMLHWREFDNDDSRAHLRKLTYDFIGNKAPSTVNVPR